ncbi:oligosaccharide flippase family protein [Providencia hangzhouensis]
MFNKKLTINFIVYTCMSLLQKLISFLMVPVITSYLSPAEFGLVNQVVAIGSVYIIFVLFALDESASRLFFERRNDNNILSYVIGSTVAVSSLFVTLSVLSLYLFKNVFYIYFIEDIYFDLIICSIVLIASSPIYYITLKVLRISENAKQFTIFTGLSIIFQIIFVFLFVVKLDLKDFGYLLSISLTSFLMAIISTLYLLFKFGMKFKLSVAKEALSFSVKIVPHTISSWGLSSFTILLIGKNLGSHTVGIYSAINYFSIIINILANSFLYSYQPWLYQKLEDFNKNKYIIQRSINTLNLLAIFIGLNIAIFSDELLLFIFGDKYFDNILISPFLIFSSVLLFMGSLHTYVLYFYKDHASKIAIATFTGAVVNVVLGFILIKYIGVYGVSFSLFSAHFSISIFKFLISNKILKLNFNNVFSYTLCFIMMALSFLVLYIELDLSIRIILMILSCLSLGIYFRNQLIVK